MGLHIAFYAIPLLCVISGVNMFETASFYGASYVTVPLQEATRTTEINLRFRTKQTDALLFLAAGRTDYCMIRLQAGKLKVHINLGAGESEISSSKGLRFDDLIWHQVSLMRKEGEVNLTIDRIHNIRDKLPGRFFELNIYDGLFLGGIGDSLDLFLGHFDWLRGCLSSVFYNGIDVLKRARYRSHQSDAHSVTWSCAAEFDSTYANEISFIEEGAYISLPNPISRTGVRWQFELKTISQNAILLYNSKLVQGGRTDYVGLEIVNKKLRLIVDTGSGSTEVSNDVIISNGEWHLIIVQLNPTVIEVTVDGRNSIASHPSMHIGNKYLDLSDMVYVGGMELNKRANALSLGMKSADISLIGCIRNMEADGKALGLPNARITHGILSSCVWQYPCSKAPCINGAACLQKGIDSFQCSCDKSSCIIDEYLADRKAPVSRASLPIALDILLVNPVRVMEGEKMTVTTENINIILDYAKYGLRSVNILFFVATPPQHGSLFINGDNVSGSSFTLADLSNDKVYYLHDGSETVNDTMVFEFEFIASPSYILPTYLEGKHAFLVDFDVAPVNDPPSLFIPEDKLFYVAQGSAKMLTSIYLNATDVDNVNSELIYTVFDQNGNFGQIEMMDFAGQSISTFTQYDVDEGRVVYRDISNSIGNIKISLQVSDGVLATAVSYLHISIFPLKIQLANNTGLILVHNSSALITLQNLTFSSNAEDMTLQIHYKVVEWPRYGLIQLLSNLPVATWKTVDKFTNVDLAQGRIRYLHTNDTPNHDYFGFKVSAKNIELAATYRFHLTFVQLQLTVVRNDIKITENQTVTISQSYLKSFTEPLFLNQSTIVYHLIKLPVVSNILLRNVILKENDTWTEADLNENRLEFRLHHKTYSYVEDSIAFVVSTPFCQPQGPLHLTLRYTPSKDLRDTIQAIIHPIQVTEGGQQPVLLENLSIAKETVRNMLYKVLDGPKNGWLDMYNADHIAVEKRNLTQFTDSDLMKQKVVYIHDDSESQVDAIQFVAYTAYKDDFQYVGYLPIEISLRNDNHPYCITNNGLHVVIDGDKLLTNKNLMYVDFDVDTKPQNITYTRQVISNGIFLLSSPPFTPLYEFTQDDINNERILFRHSGPLNSSISMWVSDGEHYSEIEFHVFASYPYVKVVNNSRLAVQQKSHSVITTAHLSSLTNMNVPSKNIRYEILAFPKNGRLHSRTATSWLYQNIAVFSQEDLEKGSVSYHHNSSLLQNQNFSDKFEFKVSVGDLSQKNEFSIRIYPQEYFEPLTLVNNRTIHVEESTSILITRNDLLVQQSGVPSSDITFVIADAPKYGYLEVDGNTVSSDDGGKESIVTSFDQLTIDAGKLHYVHLITNQTYDRLVLDVTNGIIWLKKLIVYFVIIPENLYINDAELNVKESGTVTLAANSFAVYSPYFDGKITEYRLKKLPEHGYLQFSSYGKIITNITQWTANQLRDSHIQYVNDGSETTSDLFTVIAFTPPATWSLPANVRVHISPINDEIPVVVNNTGSAVWRGASTTITLAELAAVDKDTDNNHLIYSVISAKAGHLTLNTTNSTVIIVDKFTQAQLESGLVSFVHTGENSDGYFDFIVGDGIHSTEPISFVMKTSAPTLYLSRRGKLQVFPLTKKPITSALLSAWCSDMKKDVTYVIKQAPVFGALVKENTVAAISSYISNFTQADINATRIWYQHTSRFTESVTTDKFVFNIISDFTYPIMDEVFEIEVAVSFGGLDGLLDVETYEVHEGGKIELMVNTTSITDFLSDDSIGLTDPTIKATATKGPKYGALCIDRHCHLQQFTNDQLNSGNIIYQHDNSDSSADTILLTIYLDGKNVSLCNVTLNIKITPINDQPFYLIQQSPSLTVVQGEKLALTRYQLLTEDEDTPPDQIIYDIINRPNYGNLTLDHKITASSFTQADINGEHVWYEHSGPVQSSSFYFRVSDGQFPPVYKVFQIYIKPAVLNITVVKSVPILQGTNLTEISETVFSISSNLKTDFIVHNVTLPPKNGFLLSNNSLAQHFTMNDLKLKNVVYVQTDMTYTGDSFQIESCFEFEGSPLVRNLWINITVEPLVKIGAFSPTIGSRASINENVLNADALSELTNSNPVFKVLKKPRYGKLKKIIRTSGGNKTTAREREVSKFTQQELKSAVIYYVSKKTNTPATMDGFLFLLTAPSVQPAIGEFLFRIISADGQGHVRATTSSTTKLIIPILATTPDSVFESDVEITIPNMTDDSHLLAVGLVVVVFLISLIYVYILRCRSIKQSEDEVKLNPPLPLPRPPDDLMHRSSTHPRRTPTPSSLHCKVTPLIGFDSLTSVNNYNLGYPYGTADEDWNNYDVSDAYSTRANSTMLRRNQYWV